MFWSQFLFQDKCIKKHGVAQTGGINLLTIKLIAGYPIDIAIYIIFCFALTYDG